MTEEKFASLQAAAGPVSRETFERLLQFEAIFKRWASRINLAAPSTLPHLWERHVLDSAQLLTFAGTERRWLDLGSGGGFPGAVVAILLMGRTRAHMDLVESNRKKAAFLHTSLAALGAPAIVHAKRIEDCHHSIATPEILTARALAPLPRLIALAEPWLAQGAKAFFHKGRDYLREVEESGDAWRFHLVKHNSIGGDGVILEISDLRRADSRQ